MKLKILKNHFIIMLLFFMNGAAVLLAQSSELVLIDQDYPNKMGIIASVPASVKVVELNSETNIWEQLLRELKANDEFKSVHLFAETTTNKIILTGSNVNQGVLLTDAQMDGFAKADFITNKIDLLIYSCSLAGNDSGISLLKNIALQTRLNVASCRSCESLNSDEFSFDFSTARKVITNNLFK
ncbi:DUF4347 domain-containing protein [Confluentibacter sediminis]|uniref:DUF4347 domain-containing protein n=1 Tax=Confluentibacter sediminis TaxID=2219045 RepID=UPI000DAC4976|nr:DUF4347 domain-containing protein [Confluentibacter sediminis]